MEHFIKAVCAGLVSGLIAGLIAYIIFIPLNNLDQTRNTAMELYEKCVLQNHQMTPMQYLIEYGEMPVCPEFDRKN